MGETIAGLEKIAKHFDVSTKTIQTWISNGMPHLVHEGTMIISIETAEGWVEHYRKYFDVLDGNFSVQIVQNNEVIWSHGLRNGSPYGLKSLGQEFDGTNEQIETALKIALEQFSFNRELNPKSHELSFPSVHE